MSPIRGWALVVFLGLLVFLPCPSEGVDASLEAKIRAIRQRYAKVERELKQYREVKRDLPGESAEGGELTGYFKGAVLRKIAARFYGESGQAFEEYYFWKGQVFFVLRTESIYTQPLSGLVKSRREERFYFEEEKLLRSLDAEKKPRALDAEAQERARNLVAAARKFSRLIR